MKNSGLNDWTIRTALSHRAADRDSGRKWECACSACHIIRKQMVDKDPSLKADIDEVEKGRLTTQ